MELYELVYFFWQHRAQIIMGSSEFVQVSSRYIIDTVYKFFALKASQKMDEPTDEVRIDWLTMLF